MMVSVARHGHSRRGETSPEYGAWSNMIQRCHNPKNRFYKWYGARGVQVCDDWRGPGGFDLFIDHAGDRPSAKHSIDRIDNERGYEPGNVRWATRSIQSRNTTRNTIIEIRGEALCVSDWAERVGVGRGMIFHRLSRGWPPEEAVFSPNRSPKRNKTLK